MFAARVLKLRTERSRLVARALEQRIALAGGVAPMSRTWQIVEETFAWYRVVRRSLRMLFR